MLRSQFDTRHASIESQLNPNSYTPPDEKSCGVAGVIGFIAADTGRTHYENSYAGAKNEYHYAIKDYDYR